MPEETNPLKAVLENGVLWLTKRNESGLYGITLAMFDALRGAIDEAERNPEVHIVVIDSASGYHNGAVMLTEMKSTPAELTPLDFRDLVERGQGLGRLIAGLRKPVIGVAAAGGAGGGLELLLRSDFIYTLDDAQFGLPEVTLGFVAAWGGTQWGGRLLPFRKAQEFLLLGEFISGKRADELGLVTRSFATRDALDGHVRHVLARLRNCSPAAFAGTKRCLSAIWSGPLEFGERVEVEAEVETMATRDYVGGLEATLCGEVFDYRAGQAVAKAPMSKINLPR